MLVCLLVLLVLCLGDYSNAATDKIPCVCVFVFCLCFSVSPSISQSACMSAFLPVFVSLWLCLSALFYFYTFVLLMLVIKTITKNRKTNHFSNWQLCTLQFSLESRNVFCIISFVQAAQNTFLFFTVPCNMLSIFVNSSLIVFQHL